MITIATAVLSWFYIYMPANEIFLQALLLKVIEQKKTMNHLMMKLHFPDTFARKVLSIATARLFMFLGDWAAMTEQPKQMSH